MGALAVVVLLVALFVAVRVLGERAQPDEPGAFYDQPSGDLGAPGTLLRREVIPKLVPNATTYRVLYTSTDLGGQRRAVSGVIVVPNAPAPSSGRPVVVYTHGTVGVAPRCAPSLQPTSKQSLLFEGGRELVAAGYVIAASDYQGLGTAGPHPYLVSEVEATNSLDIARAARHLDAAQASDSVAVWGHSQGGHAAIATGQLARTYAPELHLVGVAAGAPPSDMVEMFSANTRTTVGKVLIAMAMSSWAAVYHDASLDQVLKPAARSAVRDIARNCLYGPGQLLASMPGALVLKVSFLSAPPWKTEPWATIARDNSLGDDPVDAPVLVVQSDADTIIPAAITKKFVQRLCAAGTSVEFHELHGVSHLDTGHDAVPTLLPWLAARFAGEAAAASTASCA